MDYYLDFFWLKNNKTTNYVLCSEAIEAVLSFTRTAEELLKRRKVHRELIFKYLANDGVVMSLNSEKQQLVKKTLELWSPDKVRMGGQLTQP